MYLVHFISVNQILIFFSSFFKDVLKGYSAAVFAYGATGSGNILQ